MKLGTSLIAVLLLLHAHVAGATEAGTPDGQTGDVLVETVDGSRFVGSVDITSLRLMSSVGAVDLPLTQLHELTVASDHTTATVRMREGDRLTGLLTLRELTITENWGTVRIGMQKLRNLTTLGGTNEIPKVLCPGLLLWDRLDSRQDLLLGTVGAGGMLDGGQFVAGHSGKAVALDLKQADRLVFLPELGRTQAGCVEFSFKLSGLPSGRPEKAHFPLLRMETTDSNDVCEVTLTPDDGRHHGGLCVNGRLGCFASAFRRSYHSECTSKKCVDGHWHHLAVVWNGAPGTKHKIRLFLNGRPDSDVGTNQAGESLLFHRDGLVRLVFPGSAPADAVGVLSLDGLRVWDFAKTDFSDRRLAPTEPITADRPAPQVRLALDLTEGSRIIGVPIDATFLVQSELGTFEVPFAETRLVAFHQDSKRVTVVLLNPSFSNGHLKTAKSRLFSQFSAHRFL
ncbi:MAG: hypothetical protein HN919_11935 [Verrucomicrobia bacterium]|nr:hypothetical protein [Verrucomicrobiota bacterium]